MFVLFYDTLTHFVVVVVVVVVVTLLLLFFYYDFRKVSMRFHLIHPTDEAVAECTRKDLERETVGKSEESRKMLADSFYGYTTWQAVSESLDINFDE